MVDEVQSGWEGLRSGERQERGDRRERGTQQRLERGGLRGRDAGWRESERGRVRVQQGARRIDAFRNEKDHVHYVYNLFFLHTFIISLIRLVGVLFEMRIQRYNYISFIND